MSVGHTRGTVSSGCHLQRLRAEGIPHTDFGGFREESGCAEPSEDSLDFAPEM